MLTYDAVMQRAGEYLQAEPNTNKNPADVGTVAMIVQSLVDLVNADLATVSAPVPAPVAEERKSGPSGQYVTVATYKKLQTEVARLRKELDALKG